MAKTQTPTYRPDEPIGQDFNFKTFSELSAVFGEKRAAAMLTSARQKRQSAQKSVSLTREEIRITRLYVGLATPESGESWGPNSGKAMKALRGYVASDAKNKMSFAAYLDKEEARLDAEEGGLKATPPSSNGGPPS